LNTLVLCLDGGGGYASKKSCPCARRTFVLGEELKSQRRPELSQVTRCWEKQRFEPVQKQRDGTINTVRFFYDLSSSRNLRAYFDIGQRNRPRS